MGMGQNPGTPGEPQNSWDLWMFIPLKMVSIGIDPYPDDYVNSKFHACLFDFVFDFQLHFELWIPQFDT